MATSCLSAYTGSISISSTNLNRNHQWENEAALQSSLFFDSPLKTSTIAQFLNEQLTLSVSSTPRPLTIISMAPPNPGGKPRKGVEKGSKNPKQAKVGKSTIEKLRTVAQEKLPDLNCTAIESGMRIIAGTAQLIWESTSTLQFLNQK